MAIYFTSDLHLGYEPIIKKLNRPFKNLEHMHQTLIRNWNDTVSKDDEVYVLGDLSDLTASETEKIIRNLNGKIYLVKGNHDVWVDNYRYHKLEWIKDYHKMIANDAKIIMFHFPIRIWEAKGKCSVHLHGHTHKGQINIPLCYNVGVDENNFRPVSLDEILIKLNFENKIKSCKKKRF